MSDRGRGGRRLSAAVPIPAQRQPGPGQLVAIPIGADQAPPITLTRDDVTLADLDAELSRWTEWPVRIASSPGGHVPEITLNEPPRRRVGAGLQHPPADT